MSKRYLSALALLAVLAVAFGVIGTVAPPLAGDGAPVQPQQESSSDSMGHFQNPPTYDSGWVDIRDKLGQYVTLRHGLNTTDVVVDIVGRQSLEVTCGAVAWNRTYGGAADEYAYWSLVRTADGGYALAGSTQSYGAGADDFWLVKTNSAGNVVWNKTYGGADDDVAYSLLQTSDGGYALAGYTYSYGAGDSDFWLVKTDSYGTIQWSQTYGGASADSAYSLVQTSDGGYAIAGLTASYGAGGWDVYLVKTDSYGTIQWSQTYGGAGFEYASFMIQTDDGYALAGTTASYGAGGFDFWLVKADLFGMAQWNRTYGGTGADSAYYMLQTYDGGYALAGSTTSYGAGGEDSWLVKTDSAGTMQWNRTYGGSGGDIALCMTETYDGGYAIAGATSSFGAGGWDFWLVKVDFLGIVVWNKTYGGAGTDRAYSLRQARDGSYVLAGYTTSSGAGGSDFWLVKLNPELGLEHRRNLGAISIIPGWKQTYGGADSERARSLVQTADGGYALAGYTDSYGAGGSDFWLVKTDSAGNEQWSKTYGGADSDQARSLVQTADGGYALAGHTKSSGAGSEDFWLVKTDSAGTMQWNRTYGGADHEFAQSLVQTGDGGYALAGYTNSFGAVLNDLWLVKTDSAGNEQWSKTFGGTDWDVACSLVQTADGGYALAGHTKSSGAGGSDFWLVKTDSAGNEQWSKTYGGTGNDEAQSLVQTGNGEYVLAGHRSSGYGYDFWLVKTDSAGTMQWNRTYGGADEQRAYSLVQTGDGGYAIAGSTRSSSYGSRNFWLVKTDSAGNAVWNREYGGGSEEIANSVIQTSDGVYALAGYTYSYGAGGSDFWLVKTDSETGLTTIALTNSAIALYRGEADPYWNFIRARIWVIEEPTWIYGDLNMDGIVDAADLYILGRNYGKTFSVLSLGGIAAIAGIHTYKKRKQENS